MVWLTKEVPIPGTTTRSALGPIDQLLIRLIPRSVIESDLRSQSRALLLLRYALVGAVFTALFFPYFVLYLRIPITAWANGAYALSLLLTPLVLRSTRSVSAASHYTLTAALFVLLFQTLSLDGASSLAFPWLGIIPLGAMLLCGTLGGLVWTLITMASIAAVGVVDALGWLQDPAQRTVASTVTRTCNVGCLAIALGALGWLFETRANALLRHLERQRQAYHDRSIRDVLTGLANRAMLSECLIQSWERCRRNGPGGALFFIDLNEFKAINDEYGHLAGDQVLKEIALRLKDVLRRSDIAGRIGGDEFAVVVEGIANRSAVAALANKVASALEVPIELDCGPVQVGASIGIAMFPDQRCDFECAGSLPGESSVSRQKVGHETVRRLLQEADSAMYTAKREGRRHWIHGDRTSGEHRLAELA